mmetsp:Transcript_34805/g.96242  ORF Transcript_34805/g.96242 Transcript_34805/m.96242 type:complete len:261 (+) Transcript_34805:278-1060(+)
MPAGRPSDHGSQASGPPAACLVRSRGDAAVSSGPGARPCSSRSCKPTWSDSTSLRTTLVKSPKAWSSRKRNSSACSRALRRPAKSWRSSRSSASRSFIAAAASPVPAALGGSCRGEGQSTGYTTSCGAASGAVGGAAAIVPTGVASGVAVGAGADASPPPSRASRASSCSSARARTSGASSLRTPTLARKSICSIARECTTGARPQRSCSSVRPSSARTLASAASTFAMTRSSRACAAVFRACHSGRSRTSSTHGPSPAA